MVEIWLDQGRRSLKSIPYQLKSPISNGGSELTWDRQSMFHKYPAKFYHLSTLNLDGHFMSKANPKTSTRFFLI